jgi:hypothetical protein
MKYLARDKYVIFILFRVHRSTRHEKSQSALKKGRNVMTAIRIIKPAGAVATVVLLGLAGISITSNRVDADDSSESDSRVQIGFEIAPVKLKLEGLDRALVGVGSYIVNAQSDCNGCHFSPDLGGEFVVPTGMPYFLKPPKISTKVNPAGYLGGGRDFGQYPSPTPVGAFPHIFSRNLTPDVSGRPEGGHTLDEFFTILRTGHDFDGVHPTCTGAPSGHCLPAPFDGSLLQIMPWPTFASMSDNDIKAIYEYLKAIPCISHSGTIGLPANLYQTCP